jgi:hypothetical protein
LLRKVEKVDLDSWEFKSGALITLSARFARLGESESANRTLKAGVRGSFTYGYRKDTTNNEFVSAFEAIGAIIGSRIPDVAEFIARLLILLEWLTAKVDEYARTLLAGASALCGRRTRLPGTLQVVPRTNRRLLVSSAAIRGTQRAACQLGWPSRRLAMEQFMASNPWICRAKAHLESVGAFLVHVVGWKWSTIRRTKRSWQPSDEASTAGNPSVMLHEFNRPRPNSALNRRYENVVVPFSSPS